MRRKTRPFIVEVKHRHALAKKQSIWGNLNIAAATADAMRYLEPDEPTSSSLIDSSATSIDVADNDNPAVEHTMPDPQETETVEAVNEAPAAIEAPASRKKAPRPRKAKAAPIPRIAKEATNPAPKAAEAPARAKRRTYSEKERAQLLTRIEKSIGRGGSTKAAVTAAGVSEQTYYQWKKAADTAAAPADLNDLLALEEENKKLKKQLAERLRKENAELKKKLGLK